MQYNELWHGDCLELMDRIPDGAVDMILCDIPYGSTACAFDKRVKRAGLNLIIKAIEALNVNPLLVAALRALTIELYELPLSPLDLWPHFKRVIKPNGAIVMTASQPFTSVLVMSNLEWFKYEWVWDKVNLFTNHVNAKNQPMRQHENVLLFCSGQPTYNDQKRKGRPYKSRGLGNIEVYGVKRLNAVDNNGIACAATILEFPGSVYRGLHPTQKSVDLFSYLIKTYTNPGDLVLDPVAGSGTLAIAAIETGRRWLCIEKDAGYYKIAKARIEERLLQPFLPEIVESEPSQPPKQLTLFNPAHTQANGQGRGDS